MGQIPKLDNFGQNGQIEKLDKMDNLDKKDNLDKTKKRVQKKAKRIPIGLARKGARPFSKMTFPGVCAISEVGGFHVSGLAATHWQLQTFLASMRRSSKVKHL